MKTSQCTQMLAKMAETPEVKFASGKRIRSGFMGFVIKLANMVVKAKANWSADESNFSTVFTDEWDSFTAHELESSNERNSRNLGGRPTSTTSEDDETNQFDVNMDNIMKRFKCFNTIIQNNSSADDDDKDDDDETLNEPDREEDAETEAQNAAETTEAEKPKIEVLLPEPTKVDSMFADSGYWRADASDYDLDAMLADYE